MVLINFIKGVLIAVFTGLIVCSCSNGDAGGEAVISNVPAATGSSRLSGLLGNDGVGGFPLVTEQRAFRFPEDHGPHEEFRNEWWYVTGNVDSDDGERIGFELTFFRFALTPRQASAGDSAWSTNQVFVAHFALSEFSNEQFYVAQRFSRGAQGLAGASAQPFKVWLDDWSLEAFDNDADRWRLRAKHENIEVDLGLEPQKDPVLNGDNGLSQKSSEHGNASYYYSVTRLKTDGVVRIGEQTHTVSGLSWLDREWGSSALSADQVGWDWFALQLSDGSDLMFYNLRTSKGISDSYSAGAITGADGTSQQLTGSEVEITVLDYWDNGQGGRYPIAWAMRIPAWQIELTITPVMQNQELVATVRYWEGAVDVSGTKADEPINGRGYVELTGYAN